MWGYVSCLLRQSTGAIKSIKLLLVMSIAEILSVDAWWAAYSENRVY